MAEEEEEYESDPEQEKLSLNMRRRREASDDEDDNDGDVRVRVSDCEESDDDGQGAAAAAEYDNDNDNDDEYDLVEEEEVIEELEEVIEGNSVGDERENDVDIDRIDGDNQNGGVVEGEGEGEGEVKKENEPFAVPTAGAFYMHDDRFRDSAGGRHRRAFGRGKLWELRDDRKWGHDKFEELTTHERHYDEGRRVSRGCNRGRGRSRGEARQFLRGNRRKTYDNNNQVNAPKSVRGRGPRRYQPSSQNSFEPPAQNRPPAKTMEKTSNASSGRASAAISAKESAQVPVAVASSLNSASPPFYPSGSSSNETNSTQKKDAQTGSVNRGPPRGRNVSDSLGMEKLYIDDSVSSLAGKPLNNLPLPTQPRGPHSFNQAAYQPVPPHRHNQVNRVPNQLNLNLQSSGQQFGPRSASGSRASSPPTKASLESVEIESSTESNDFKTTLVGKGKGSIPSSGMSSFSYSDQNFPGAPKFLPVMQFAGQHHPGGLGVPAVGMAFPGYVSQPNGMGNSEMTWLPVLASAAGALGTAGALGATYPYITMDGAYHPRPSGQASSLPPPTNKPANEVKPSQKPEFSNDELRQRQNKARRYTEMKFDK